MDIETDVVRGSFVYEVHRTPGSNWCVSRYKDTGTKKVFTATGTDLPRQKGMTVEFHGRWVSGFRREEREFKTAWFVIPEQDSREGVIAFMQSLRCGIGLRRAKEIWAAFGSDTWNVLDNSPERLAGVKGISELTVRKLEEKLAEARQQRNIMALCTRARVPVMPYQINRLLKRYPAEAEYRIRENPYCLLHAGVQFESCDLLADHLGLNADSPHRIEAAITKIFTEASFRGHVCLPRTDVLDSGGAVAFRGLLSELTRFLGMPEDICRTAINRACENGRICVHGDYIFTSSGNAQEDAIARNLVRIMNGKLKPVEDIEAQIKQYEEKNMTLAEEQRYAVKSVFGSQVNIITGGPGTGKTTIIKAILDIHRTVFGDSSAPMLLAPTGKAARRMSEATGYPAQTIHSAVGYQGEDFEVTDSVPLKGNLYIIDESSMLDQEICGILLKKIPADSKVVLVGDVDQLPSVGCGNVLCDMIRSGVIPTTRLNVIFRQAEGNPIIANSRRINNGDANLEFSRTFRFIETSNNEDTLRKACDLYARCVKAYGIDNVILLNPQRNNTELSVDAFNRTIQSSLHDHPQLLGQPGGTELEMKKGNCSFRAGDRVMQLRNTDIAKNGETGYIRKIEKYADPDDPERWSYRAMIEFNDDGRLHPYSEDDIRDIDLGYCTTVHKSQGSEYRTVLMIVSEEHKAMLRKDILYTGTTRSRENLAYIGQKNALVQAIHNNRRDCRHTMLAQRIAYNARKSSVRRK